MRCVLFTAGPTIFPFSTDENGLQNIAEDERTREQLFLSREHRNLTSSEGSLRRPSVLS